MELFWKNLVNISTEELNSPDKINLIGNAIGSVNPEDIERVDILKDASATAIYGTKRPMELLWSLPSKEKARNRVSRIPLHWG